MRGLGFSVLMVYLPVVSMEGRNVSFSFVGIGVSCREPILIIPYSFPTTHKASLRAVSGFCCSFLAIVRFGCHKQ